jgi:hypothetical protein
MNRLLKLKQQPETFTYPELTPPYVLETKLRANGGQTGPCPPG